MAHALLDSKGVPLLEVAFLSGYIDHYFLSLKPNIIIILDKKIQGIVGQAWSVRWIANRQWNCYVCICYVAIWFEIETHILHSCLCSHVTSSCRTWPVSPVVDLTWLVTFKGFSNLNHFEWSNPHSYQTVQHKHLLDFGLGFDFI